MGNLPQKTDERKVLTLENVRKKQKRQAWFCGSVSLFFGILIALLLKAWITSAVHTYHATAEAGDSLLAVLFPEILPLGGLLLAFLYEIIWAVRTLLLLDRLCITEDTVTGTSEIRRGRNRTDYRLHLANYGSISVSSGTYAMTSKGDTVFVAVFRGKKKALDAFSPLLYRLEGETSR